MRESVGRKYILKLSGVREHQVSTLKIFKEDSLCLHFCVYNSFASFRGFFSKVENNYIKYIICALN